MSSPSSSAVRAGSIPIVVGAVVVGLAALWLQNAIVPFSTPFWGLFDNQLDLGVYRAGAQTVLDGHPLYEAKLLGQMDYTYTPFSIFGFIPFAWLPEAVAKAVWIVGLLLALYATIMISFRSLGRTATWQLRVVAGSLVAVVLLLEPVRTTIWYGQINIFLMVVVLADLLRGDSRLRGVATGLTAGIKLTPGLFAVYLLLIRRTRAAIGVVVGFVVSVVLGFLFLPGTSWDYWTKKLRDSDRVGAPLTPGNQSLRGVLANLGDTNSPNTFAWLGLVVLGLAFGLGAAVVAHRAGQELVGLSLVGLTSCAVSPMAWGHHWVWFVPLLVFALNWVADGARSTVSRVVVGVMAAAGFLAAFSWRTFLGYPTWQFNQTRDDAYLIGLFFKHGNVPGLDLWVYEPYVWIFAATCVAVLVAWGNKPPAPAPAVGAHR
ncbi:MAG: glycosyltransferase 87 family protein [Gordonia sp. (in: high G+C Gram-positive bacteria)]|uniref:glycosyltransferase 87 family protein n=1 Tax=Gordonia sp. (in: high G+C Gram-positive bacteria) TaxID=84139 RepID=UPI0039E40E49